MTGVRGVADAKTDAAAERLKNFVMRFEGCPTGKGREPRRAVGWIRGVALRGWPGSFELNSGTE
jgi:hypothetical protein